MHEPTTGGRRSGRSPPDQVFARVCAIGPAGNGQLAGPPGPGMATATGTDGIRRCTAPIGQPPVTTGTVGVDPAGRTLAVQGHCTSSWPRW
jgi:hypothetical protein